MNEDYCRDCPADMERPLLMKFINLTVRIFFTLLSLVGAVFITVLSIDYALTQFGEIGAGLVIMFYVSAVFAAVIQLYKE